MIIPFFLPLVMRSYLNQLDSIKNKKVFCFVTKGLSFNWTGGNKANNQMKKICAQKGAQVSGSKIIKWGKKRQNEEIDEVVKKVKILIEGL